LQWDAKLQHNKEHNARWRPVEITSHPEREKICKMQIIFREFIKVKSMQPVALKRLSAPEQATWFRK